MEPYINCNVMFMSTAKEIGDALSMMYSSDKNLVCIF